MNTPRERVIGVREDGGAVERNYSADFARSSMITFDVVAEFGASEDEPGRFIDKIDF